MSKPARIIWTKPAAQDVDAIWEYLRERSTNAAEHVLNTILKAVDRLAEFPYSGRPGHLAETRELVIARYPYIVVYGVIDVAEPTEVVVYRVFHGTQNWREALDDAEGG